MIEILKLKDENILGFRVDGKVEKTDIERVLSAFKEKSGKNGKIKLYVEVKDISPGDLSAEAIKEEFKFWLSHPGLIAQIEKGVVVTDREWIKTAYDIECALIPTLTGESFSFDEKEEALEWLQTDQRKESRMDITFSEFVETAALKAAGGFALGLLTAGLFGEKNRKNIGKAVLFGSIAAGIPLAVKVLNNNRKLLSP